MFVNYDYFHSYAQYLLENARGSACNEYLPRSTPSKSVSPHLSLSCYHLLPQQIASAVETALLGNPRIRTILNYHVFFKFELLNIFNLCN
jgi:hypothetical protein